MQGQCDELVGDGLPAAEPDGITRRAFLKLSAVAAGLGLAADRMLKSAMDGLVRFGIPVPWHRRGPVTTTYGYCDMCLWRCGIVAHSVGGRVRKIDGDPADPKSRGMLCARGQGGVSFLYDPDRLTRPQIRVGERGEGRFRDATWDEALHAVVAGMPRIAAEHGPEAVAILGHTSGDSWFVDYLAQAWGTPNAARPSPRDGAGAGCRSGAGSSPPTPGPSTRPGSCSAPPLLSTRSPALGDGRRETKR